MNIEHLFPETDLKVYKVTEILSDEQNKLLTKLAEEKIPTGYRQSEIEQAVQDIRSASVRACETIFGVNSLQATPENKSWPWFDLSVGEGRGYESSGLYPEDQHQFFAEFMVQPSSSGGEISFKMQLLPGVTDKAPINLAPGEMLVASRGPHHDFEITEITSGLRFTLMTHIHP
jgi:hypothetical protein